MKQAFVLSRRLTVLTVFLFVIWALIGSMATLAAPCSEGSNVPVGYKLVLCSTPGAGDSVASLGWTADANLWTVVQGQGRHWIQGVSAGASHAYIEVPAMGNADQVVVEYTAQYTSTGNTWAFEFLSDDPEQALGTNYMLLSAWNGVYFRRYDNSQAVAASTVISDPKIEVGETVTIRAAYDYTNKTVSVYRNGQLLPQYPHKLPDNYLIKGPEHNLVKLYVNTGGAAGETTARFTDIRVWVK